MRYSIPAVILGLAVGGLAGGATLASALNEPAKKPPTVRVCVGKKSTVVSANKEGRCPKGTTRTRINKHGPTVTTTVTPSPTGTPTPTPTSGVIDGGTP